MNEQKDLEHLDPDCTGTWHEVSARNVKGIKGRTGRFYWCPECTAHLPSGYEFGYQRAFFNQFEINKQLREAFKDRKAIKAMAAAIRRKDVTITWDHAEELAEEAFAGLRESHLRVEEDIHLRLGWERRVRDTLHDLDEAVSHILSKETGDGAKVLRQIVDERSGSVKYHIQLPPLDAVQRMAVESQLEQAPRPEAYPTVQFVYHEAA